MYIIQYLFDLFSHPSLSPFVYCACLMLYAPLTHLKMWLLLFVQVYPSVWNRHQRCRPRQRALLDSFLLVLFIWFSHLSIAWIHTHALTYTLTHTHTHTLTHTHTYTHTHSHTHTHTELGCYHTCTKDTPSFALNCTYRVFNSPIKMPAISASTTKCSLMQLSCWVRVCP